MNFLKERFVQRALAEGFDLCRICSPDSIPDSSEKLDKFLQKGYHGQMAWLSERKIWRGNPKILWPKAESIIMLAHNYSNDIAKRYGSMSSPEISLEGLKVIFEKRSDG